jgi:hypothetical protein
VLAFKKQSPNVKLLRKSKSPSTATVDTLSRQLWEFGEQVWLARLDLDQRAGPQA